MRKLILIVLVFLMTPKTILASQDAPQSIRKSCVMNCKARGQNVLEVILEGFTANSK